MKTTSLLSVVVLCTMCLGAVCKVEAKTIYLNTGGSSLWETANANKFAVWHWAGSSSGAWSSWMTKVEGNVWKTDISDGSNMVIFCRFNTSMSSPEWNDSQIWNKTGDESIPSGMDLFTMTDWSQGEWSKYGSSGGNQGGNQGGGTETPTTYSSAVPSQCEDIMLQAFYWKSNINSGYGDTKWRTLISQVSDISSCFSLVWLPPSGMASGISQGGLGYIPLRYDNQGCQMGGKGDLKSLISAFHNNGIRVLADIVINHIGNPSGNCTLEKEDFGSYGSFTPTKDWLTSDDEGGCGSSGNKDDGQHNPNFDSARDWDHKNSNVQAMCKAYLQWMLGEMTYDGFRYDWASGYHVSHIKDYNGASKPYFSVMEYWLGDASVLKTRVDEAGKNTLVFDFDAKYNALRDGIYYKNYTKCLNAGLRGRGYSKYAVTFVDNHDTFNRGSENEDVACKRDGSSINDKSLMMRCYAYILSLPGVPCVFWPHWVKYKSELRQMINARKKAGIHSESSMQEQAGRDYYRATIQGKYGSVMVMLGTAANDAQPTGYTLAIKGTDYAMYYKGEGKPEQPSQQGIENVQSELDKTQPMYNMMGQRVDDYYRGVVIQNGHKYLLTK